MDAMALARRWRDRLKSAPPVYWSLRWTRMAIGELAPPKQLPGVPGRIHANDAMIPRRILRHVPGYVGSGKQIAQLIASHLTTEATEAGRPGPAGETTGDTHTGRPDPARETTAPRHQPTGLDFGCGYGRVLRHLVADLPHVRWTAADVDRRAVRFCQWEFGATGVISSARIAEVAFGDAPFDIVWMGSLLTHLPAEEADGLWSMLRSNLRPGGLLALSTHGPGLVERIDEWVPHGSAQIERVNRELAGEGFSYVQYPHYRRSSYGVAFHTRDFLVTTVNDRFGSDTCLLSAEERAWLETQDIYLFQVGPVSRWGRAV